MMWSLLSGQVIAAFFFSNGISQSELPANDGTKLDMIVVKKKFGVAKCVNMTIS